jgi:hypothetical protein
VLCVTAMAQAGKKGWCHDDSECNSEQQKREQAGGRIQEM